MSMTLADLKKIEPKFDLEQQLLQLQQMSRWDFLVHLYVRRRAIKQCLYDASCGGATWN